MSSKTYEPAPEGFHYIFRPYFTLPNGEKVWAKMYGKRAFAILVPDGT